MIISNYKLEDKEMINLYVRNGILVIRMKNGPKIIKKSF